MTDFSNVQTGQRVKLTFEDRDFEVIVIDPNGLGKGQPTIGFGFRMMEQHGGLPEPTLSNHDRDVNAAKNIRDEGLRLLELGTSSTAYCPSVRRSSGRKKSTATLFVG